MTQIALLAGAETCHKRLRSAKSFAPGSFRTKRTGSALLVVACPKGRYRHGRCQTAMVAQSLLKYARGKCPKGYKRA